MKISYVSSNCICLGCCARDPDPSPAFAVAFGQRKTRIDQTSRRISTYSHAHFNIVQPHIKVSFNV